MALHQRGAEIILGDIIVSINNEPIRSYDDFKNEFDKHKVGNVVTLGILRDGKSSAIHVRLEEV